MRATGFQGIFDTHRPSASNQRQMIHPPSFPLDDQMMLNVSSESLSTTQSHSTGSSLPLPEVASTSATHKCRLVHCYGFCSVFFVGQPLQFRCVQSLLGVWTRANFAFFTSRLYLIMISVAFDGCGFRFPLTSGSRHSCHSLFPGATLRLPAGTHYVQFDDSSFQIANQ